MVGTWFQLTRRRAPDFQIERRFRNATVRVIVLATVIIGWYANAVHAAPIPNYVTAAFDPVNQRLTLTGDDLDNLVNVTWTANSTVVVTALGNTRIGNSSSSVTSVSFHAVPSFQIVATMNGGNDYVGFITVPSPSVNLSMGDGDDYVKFTYSSVAGLTLDGGKGTNTLAKITSRVTILSILNIQVNLPTL